MGIKYKVNESFFNTWTTEMAYILGYLYADGSLEDASYLRGKYLRVTSTDESSIVRIRELLKSEHPITIREPRWGTFFGGKRYQSKKAYMLRVGSHKIYDSLLGLGIYPNKSLTVKFPIVSKEHFPHFVRGYFDGDGCVYLEMGKGITKDRIVKRLAVIFTSGSIDFLTGLQKQLEVALGLKGKIYHGNRAYRLRYCTGDSVKLFPFLYHKSQKLFLQRKFNIFNDYFKLRPSRIDNSIKEIITELI